MKISKFLAVFFLGVISCGSSAFAIYGDDLEVASLPLNAFFTLPKELLISGNSSGHDSVNVFQAEGQKVTCRLISKGAVDDRIVSAQTLFGHPVKIQFKYISKGNYDDGSGHSLPGVAITFKRSVNFKYLHCHHAESPITTVGQMREALKGHLDLVVPNNLNKPKVVYEKIGFKPAKSKQSRDSL